MEKIENLVKKGEAFLEEGNFEDALGFFEQALLLDQKNPELWNHKGVALRSLGRYDEAIECFNKSLEIEPRDKTASWFELVRFFVDNELRVLSKKYYLCWISKLYMDYLSKAYELCQDGNYQKALKYFDLVLQKNPKNINAIIDKGVTLQNLNKFQSSVQMYNKALELDPNYIDALVNKGSSLHSLGKYAEAIKCYDLALKIDKKCTMALAYKGLSLGELGQIQEALKLFKQALKLDSDYDLAKISHKKALEILKASRIMKI